MNIDTTAVGAHYGAHIDIVKERHDRALEKAGASCVIIFSGAPKPVFLDDYDYPFKTNPHYLGWLPLTDTPYSYIIYTPGEKPILLYFQPEDYWHMPPAAPSGYWVNYFDIRLVSSMEQVAAELAQSRDTTILIGDIDDPAMLAA